MLNPFVSFCNKEFVAGRTTVKAALSIYPRHIVDTGGYAHYFLV